MKPGLLVAACLCALFSSFAVDAQTSTMRPLIGGHGDNVDAFIAQHDDNADGRLTWAEFDTFRRHRFDATDSNGGGTVDVEEYVQEFDDRVHRALEAGRGEHVEAARRRFAAIDADKDGKVSRAEFDASGERVFARGREALAGSGEDAKPADVETRQRANRGRNRLSMPSSHTREGFLTLFDGNGDGKVDEGEFDAVRAERFAGTDGDRDGAIDEDEYLAEYEDRLDRRIAVLGTGSDRQTRVRFRSMDTDKDGRMTFAEYQVSGKRTFDGADRNKDRLVDAADAKLPPPERRRTRPAAGSTGN